MHRRMRLIIFDFDGVVADSELVANQVLAKENMNVYPLGDVHYRPSNSVAVESGASGAQGPANALDPLWRDAAQRVATRLIWRSAASELTPC